MIVQDPEHLLENNRRWASGITATDPTFFQRLSRIQTPRFLWIGCSDSRVPATQIVDVAPGEIFVHRNVGNLVVHSDLNCLSTIQFAVDLLQVRHIIVCGHYNCSAVGAALRDERLGLADNWLRHLEDVARNFETELRAGPGEEWRLHRLAELNVVTQVVNVARTSILEEAWSRLREVSIHGWIYGMEDGLIRDLDVSLSRGSNIPEVTARAIAERLRIE